MRYKPLKKKLNKKLNKNLNKELNKKFRFNKFNKNKSLYFWKDPLKK